MKTCLEIPEKKSTPLHKRAGKLLTLTQNSKLQVVLRIGITVLFVIMVNRSIKLKELEHLFGSFNLWIAGIALLLGAVGILLQAYRWRMVLCSQDLPCGRIVVLKTLLWGNLLAFITPGRIGELFRGLQLDSQRKAVSVLAVVIDRFFAIAVTLLFGIAAIFSELFFFRRVPHPLFMFPFITLVVFITILIFLLNFSSKLGKIAFIEPYILKLSSFCRGLSILKLKQIIILSVITHCCLIIQTSILLYMFGSMSIWKNCLIAMQAYTFMIFLPFFVANIGLREYSFSLFLKEMELVGTSQAFIPVASLGVSMMVLLINIVIPALAGLVWKILEKRGS